MKGSSFPVASRIRSRPSPKQLASSQPTRPVSYTHLGLVKDGLFDKEALPLALQPFQHLVVEAGGVGDKDEVVFPHLLRVQVLAAEQGLHPGAQGPGNAAAQGVDLQAVAPLFGDGGQVLQMAGANTAQAHKKHVQISGVHLQPSSICSISRMTSLSFSKLQRGLSSPFKKPKKLVSSST